MFSSHNLNESIRFERRPSFRPKEHFALQSDDSIFCPSVWWQHILPFSLMTAYLSKSSLNIEWAVGKFSLILKSGNVGFNHIDIGRCSGNRQLHWKWNRQCTLARKLESANCRPSIYVTNRTQQQELSVVKFLKLTICVCLRIFGCVYYPLLSAE